MDDLEFVQSCIRNDKSAWEELLNKYSRLIYSYIYNVTQIKGYILAQNDIEEIFQEFIYALIADNFKKLRSYKGLNGCSLASWLRQLAINFTLNYLRKFKAPPVSLDKETEEGLSLKDTLADNAQNQIEYALYKERLVSLAECIKRLDIDDRYFLELNINREIGLEVLKDFFGVSRGVIDVRKSRIIQNLRACFKHKGFGGII